MNYGCLFLFCSTESLDDFKTRLKEKKKHFVLISWRMTSILGCHNGTRRVSWRNLSTNTPVGGFIMDDDGNLLFDKLLIK